MRILREIGSMKRIYLLSTFLVLSTSLLAQTIIIDYTEKTIEDEYVIHYLAKASEPKTAVYEDITAAKKELLKILEDLQKDGFEIAASTISSHKHWHWFKKGMHYHYQYILQNSRMEMPVMPGREMNNQRPNDQKRQMRKEQKNRPGSGQGGGRNGGGRRGQGGGSMNHGGAGGGSTNQGGSGGGSSQGAPPPPPPSGGEAGEQPPPEGGMGGGNTPPPRPNDQGKDDGDGSDGRKVPNPAKGSVKTGL